MVNPSSSQPEKMVREYGEARIEGPIERRRHTPPEPEAKEGEGGPLPWEKEEGETTLSISALEHLNTSTYLDPRVRLWYPSAVPASASPANSTYPSPVALVTRQPHVLCYHNVGQINSVIRPFIMHPTHACMMNLNKWNSAVGEGT